MPNDWAEGTQENADGATRDYYNRAGKLAWENYLGDWHDADDTPQGSRPYATANIEDIDTPRYIEWDVLPLVQEWVDGRHANQGFLIHMISGAGPINLVTSADPIGGIAACYTDDIGISGHPDVIFATGFESAHWQDEQMAPSFLVFGLSMELWTQTNFFNT